MYRWAVTLNRSREIVFQNVNRIITVARIVSIKRRSVHRPRNVNTLVEIAESFQGARKHVQVGSSIKSRSGNSIPKRQQNNNRSQDSQYKKEVRT